MSQVLRTEATDEKTGFMKVVVSASDDRILGFAMIGSEAGEVLAVVQTAMLLSCAFQAPVLPVATMYASPFAGEPGGAVIVLLLTERKST